jgi:hypothetical protein
MRNIMIFIVLIQAAFAYQITEVMYNPVGDDNNKEFIEVMASESLDGFIVKDSSSEDKLVPLSVGAGFHALITEDGFLCPENVLCYSAGTTIGNNLNNGADCVYLYFPNRSLADSMCYDGSIANGDGYSLELLSGSWVQSSVMGGTPGYVAIEPVVNASVPKSNETLNITPLNTSNTVTSNTTSISLNGSSLNSTINQPLTNNTVNVPVNQSGPISLTQCNITVQISTDKLLYQDGEPVKYRISVFGTDNYVTEYWIESISGKVVKAKFNSTNSNERSWTAGCEKGSAFLIRARTFSCMNLTAYHLVTLNCTEQIIENDLHIKEVLIDDDLRFGDALKVRLNISKGSDAKTSISVWVEGTEKVSEVTSLNVYTKHSNMEVLVPVRLKDEDFDSGTYTVVAEGLGLTDSKQLRIDEKDEKDCPENTCPKCQVCEKCKVTKSPEKSEIKSFYTLASKYNDRIRLFANVDCKNCSLFLQGRNETKRMLVTNSSKLDFNMTFSSDYTLDLCESSKALHLDIEKPVVEKKKTEAKANATKAKSPAPQTSYQSKEIVNKGRMKYFIYSILGILGLIVLFRRF